LFAKEPFPSQLFSKFFSLQNKTMDEAIFELSQKSDIDPQKFINKSVLYVLDSNQSSYSGNQLFFETSSLANSGRWLSFRDAYIMIPIVIGCKASTNVTATMSPFSCGFKNGYYQLIDSMTVELNGQNIVQLCPYTNVWSNFKVLNTWSRDALTKYGPSLGVWPDTSTSIGYNAAADLNGIGIFNNNAYGAPTSLSGAIQFIGQANNSGFLNRMYFTGFTTGGFAGAGAFYAEPKTTGMSYFSNDAVAAGGRTYFWSIVAKIRLRDIHDYFDKVPLLKGSYYRFVINLNSAAFTISGVAAAHSMSLASASAVTVQGRTNPIMVASAVAGNPMRASVDVANGTFAFSMGIGSTTPAGGALVKNGTFASGCRLYVPTFYMNPTYEEQYISLHPTKTIEYEDTYNFYISGISPGGQINNLLTNGVINPKKLLVVPVLSNFATDDASTLPSLYSPFSSGPATTCPFAAIQSFQVQVGGVNLFMANQDYDFMQYMDELRSAFALNGGETDQLTSGLLSELDFQSAYRFYFCDLERRLPADDVVPKSILIQGRNASSQTIDLITFCSLGRQITVNTINSAIIEG
jgi:hypothetical protein